MRKLIKKHKRKIIYSCPIIFLIFLSYSSLLTPISTPITEIVLTASSTEGYVGDSFSVEVNVHTDTPINVVEAGLVFPSDILEVTEINQSDSLINIWVTEPTFLNTIGTVSFSGGILRQGGFVKKGKIITIFFTPKKEGTAIIQTHTASFALADGMGTLITPKTNEITYKIKEKPTQNPDINKSGTVNLIDAGLWLTNIFKPYKTQNDLNGDGAINLRDMYFFW
jgi:hypothetical protein